VRLSTTGAKDCTQDIAPHRRLADSLSERITTTATRLSGSSAISTWPQWPRPAALALLPADAAEAAAGALDPSFGSGGCSTVSLGSWAGAAAGVVQSGWKIDLGLRPPLGFVGPGLRMWLEDYVMPLGRLR
jgi:hypothetical protein